MLKIKVLYEDNHLLVVEKPINMPVQKDISGDEDLLTALKGYIKGNTKAGGCFLFGYRWTAVGIMAFANRQAFKAFGQSLRTVQKEYLGAETI